jgi:hypothetical protein
VIVSQAGEQRRPAEQMFELEFERVLARVVVYRTVSRANTQLALASALQFEKWRARFDLGGVIHQPASRLIAMQPGRVR